MKHLFAYEMSKLASLWMKYKFTDEVLSVLSCSWETRILTVQEDSAATVAPTEATASGFPTGWIWQCFKIVKTVRIKELS